MSLRAFAPLKRIESSSNRSGGANHKPSTLANHRDQSDLIRSSAQITARKFGANIETSLSVSGNETTAVRPNLIARAQRHQQLLKQRTLQTQQEPSVQKFISNPAPLKNHQKDSMKTKTSLSSSSGHRASPLPPPRTVSLESRALPGTNSPNTRSSLKKTTVPPPISTLRPTSPFISKKSSAVTPFEPPKNSLISVIDSLKSSRIRSSNNSSLNNSRSSSISNISGRDLGKSVDPHHQGSKRMQRSMMTPPRKLSSIDRLKKDYDYLKESAKSPRPIIAQDSSRQSPVRTRSRGSLNRLASFSTDNIPPPSPNASNIKYMANAKRKRKLGIRESIPKITPARHMIGFSNLGNTCFMNSALQCLLSSELLVSFFFFNQYEHDLNSHSSTKGHLAEAFAGVITEIYGKNARTVAPRTLKARFEKHAPDFLGYNQQDAQEFLRFLLDGLHEDLNRVKIRPKLLYDEKIEDTLDDIEKANLAWNRYHSLNDSFVFDLFGGQLQSTIHCLKCNYQSSTFDTFWDLSLPIPKESETKVRRSVMVLNSDFKQCSLQDCLQAFAAEEVLDGTEKYHCPRCKCPQKSTKKLRIYKYPEIMVLHIKRFMQTRFGREKLTTGVSYPPVLSEFDAIGSDLEGCDEMPQYELIAICCHSGGLGGGHYVAHCKSIEDGQWYLCNDSNISPSSISGHESSAYMLFYKRINVSQ